MISFGYHFNAGEDTDGGDEIVKRKAYLNEVKAYSYIRQINLSDNVDGQLRKVNKDKLVIGFSKNDLPRMVYTQDDPLVITTRVHEARVARILINNGSLVDIIFYNRFHGLGLHDNELEPYHKP